MKIAKKNYGILGLGRTGISAFNYLEAEHNVVCWDDNEKSRKNFAEKFGEKYLVNNTHQDWNNLDEIVVSPGIPSSNNIFKQARANNIKITSDMELFLQKHKGNKKIIAVTGTNGKTTTVSLIHHILITNGMNYALGGNIGVPVLELEDGVEGYVLELSSFQLDLLDGAYFDIAALINIAPDHLDRYDNYKSYCQSKVSIFKNAKTKIIGIDSEESKRIYDRNPERFIAVSTDIISPNAKGVMHLPLAIKEQIFEPTAFIGMEWPYLPGQHNRQNVAIAFAVCRTLGIDGEGIINSVKNFRSLEHRIEYVGTKNGVSYYNDSKATNIDAACCALNSFENIYWLAGGVLKERDLSMFANYLGEVKKAFLFGRDAEILAKYLAGKVQTQIFDNMEQAFKQAQIESHTRGGGTILLSPACASNDQFKNFEERGNKFKVLYDKTEHF